LNRGLAQPSFDVRRPVCVTAILTVASYASCRPREAAAALPCKKTRFGGGDIYEVTFAIPRNQRESMMAKGYIIAELNVTKPGSEWDAYREQVMATVEAFGGHFLARGGESSLLEGDHPAGRMVILEFESQEQAMAWYNSPAYQKVLPLRTKNALTRVLCAAGA
jgi:uncharacterized protein (DUF1330 family)